MYGGRAVDPGGGREGRGLGGLADEALGVAGVGGVEHLGAAGADRLGLAVVDGGGGREPEPRVAVLGVVPAKERAAEGAGVLDRAEARREARAVLRVLNWASE
jgi:hypothetical protein